MKRIKASAVFQTIIFSQKPENGYSFPRQPLTSPRPDSPIRKNGSHRYSWRSVTCPALGEDRASGYSPVISTAAFA